MTPHKQSVKKFPYFFGKWRKIGWIMHAGNALISHAANAIGSGNAIIALFLRIPLMIILAAFSGCIKNGILNTFLSVSGVLIKPGQITFTLMPCGFNHPRKASPHALTHALLAEYPGAEGNPR